MICIRCGYCCKNYFVVIVKDPSKGIKEDNLTVHNGQGNACPHLEGDEPREYACAIHDESWYKETPCFSHGQIERGNTNCRMGEYILNKEKQNAS